MIKDSLNIYANKKILDQKCVSCHSLDHFASECPMITPTFNHSKILKNYQNDALGERKKIFRAPHKKLNALAFSQKIYQKTEDFQKLDLYYLSCSIGFFNNIIFVLIFKKRRRYIRTEFRKY